MVANPALKPKHVAEVPVAEIAARPPGPRAVRSADEPLRLLWVFKSVGMMRHFGNVIERQLKAGHQVHVVYESLLDGAQYADDQERLAPYKNFKSERLTKKFIKYIEDKDTQARRSTWDYLRYFHPTFAKADFLRSRVEPMAWPWVVKLAKTGIFHFPPARWLAERWLTRLELEQPNAAEPLDIIRAHDPDVVIVSPLIWWGSRQTDFVKAARELGVPTVLGVASWDNLSNKGAIRLIPDKVMVWNQTQVEEAMDFHRVPRSRLIATGAQTLDLWFERQPSLDKAAYLRRHGLDPARKLLVYLCSSASIGGDERPFIQTWLDAVRSSADPELAGANVLIRPHPKNRKQWEGSESLGGAPVTPLDDGGFYGFSGQENLFDTLYHADALVGLNTTAMIEAAILRKPVLTPQLSHMPEVRRATEEMYHFRYLSGETGGFVRIAHSMDQHLEQLSGALADPGAYRESADRFVAHFIRPHGREVAGVQVMADAIDQVARAARADRQARGRRAG